MFIMRGVSPRSALRAFFAILLLIPAIPAVAQSGVATVAADATIYEEQPNDNAGADAEYCIGNLDTSETRRAFVRFDLPDIPAGAVITRVVYEFTQNRVRRSCVECAATLLMNRVTESWVEGTGSGPGGGPCGGGAAVAGVNWANQPAVGGISAMEALPDTGLTPTPIAIDTDIGADDDQLIADIQGWIDGTFQNFGWRLQVSEETTANNARAMDPGSMTIHWTAPPLDYEDGFEDLP